MNRIVGVYVGEAVLITGVWAWFFARRDYPLDDWTWALMMVYGCALLVNRLMGYPLGWLAQSLNLDLRIETADPSFSIMLFGSVGVFNGGLIYLLANFGFRLFGLSTTSDTYVFSGIALMLLGVAGFILCFATTRQREIGLGSSLLQLIFGLRPRYRPS